MDKVIKDITAAAAAYDPFHLPADQMRRLGEMLSEAQRPVITCHTSPDGDAMGSTLALCSVLRAMGKEATVVTPDMPPLSLTFMPGMSSVVVASQKQEKAATLFAEADLIICLDFNALMRVDRMQPMLESAAAPKVLIDHHLDPESFAQITVSRPEASSTCLLLYHVMRATGLLDRLTPRSAELLYTGMMTDTGAFSYNSNAPEVYLAVADLAARGANLNAVYKRVYDTATESSLRICGMALSRRMSLIPEHKAAVIVLDKTDLLQWGYRKGDTEGLVNRPLQMQDVVWSVYLRQDSDNFVKVSMRSKGSFPVNLVCTDNFGGGGHLNAAGGEFYGSLEACIQRLLEAMPQYDKYLHE